MNRLSFGLLAAAMACGAVFSAKAASSTSCRREMSAKAASDMKVGSGKRETAQLGSFCRVRAQI